MHSDDKKIDYAASPVLTIVRDYAGEAAVMRLIEERGGSTVVIPQHPLPHHALPSIIGVKATKKLADVFGCTCITIPTGSGHGHGRRLDYAAIIRAIKSGQSLTRVAHEFGCSDRQVSNIKKKFNDDPRRFAQQYGDTHDARITSPVADGVTS